MAKSEIERQASQNRQNRFLLLLLVAAALVSVAKDIVRLHDFTSEVSSVVTSAHQAVTAALTSSLDTDCPQQVVAENDNSAQPFNWNGRVAPDQRIRIGDSSGGVEGVPAIGANLDVALISSCESQPVRIQRGSAAEVATTLKQVEYSRRSRTNDLGRSHGVTSLVTIGVRNNADQTRVDVRVPIAIAYLGAMMHDGAGATPSESDLPAAAAGPIATARVDTYFANDRLNISAAYPQARILSRAINVRAAKANCPGTLKFKTAHKVFAVDLLRLLRANLETELPDSETSDAQQTIRVVIHRSSSAIPEAADEEAH